MTSEAIKKSGSDHYKTGGVEPIDLYEQGGMLRDFALCSIIKYAYRCRRDSEREPKLVTKDMSKIQHYAEMVKELADKTGDK